MYALARGCHDCLLAGPVLECAYGSLFLGLGPLPSAMVGLESGAKDKDAAPVLMRKKVDQRVKTLVENGVRTKHRTFFAIIGNKVQLRVPVSR